MFPSIFPLINNNTERTLDVVFSRFRGFLFTISLRQKSKGVTRILSPCLVIQRSMRATPLGFCLRVIVDEKPLNLEKTTSSVLSVLLLIYGFIGLTVTQVFLPVLVFQKYGFPDFC